MARDRDGRRVVLFRLVLGMVVALAVFSAQGLVSAVEGPSFHIVQPGDTLSAISQTYGIPIEKLAEANDLKDPNFIVVGQRLRLPGATAPSDQPRQGGQEYVVRPGETLWQIASAHGVPLRLLIELNSISNPDVIYAGQRLLVPASTGPDREQTPSPRPSATPAPSVTPAPSPTGAPANIQGVEAMLEAAAARHGLDPALVKALAWYESFWRPDAVSPAGARGVMQIKPATLEWIGQAILDRRLDPNSVTDNIDAGVAFLAYLVKSLGDERLAVASYMQGPLSVRQQGVLARTEKAIEEIYRLRQLYASGGRPGRATGSAAATATPAASLEQRIRSAIEAAGGREARVGVAARNLSSGETVRLRADEVFRGASVLKVPIMVELYRQLGAERLSLPDHLRPLLTAMITVSDNDAANRLAEIVGRDNVNRTMASLGLTSTILRHPFSDAPLTGETSFNQTSPADMAALMEMLANDRLISAQASKEMKGLLSQVKDDSKLKLYLPADAQVAHKSGWFSGVSNDVGIVTTRRGTYVVAILTEGPFDSEGGNRLVGAISKAVYDAWGG